jgi:hypothetical protein
MLLCRSLPLFAYVACASAFVPGPAVLPGANRYQCAENARSGLSLRGSKPLGRFATLAPLKAREGGWRETPTGAPGTVKPGTVKGPGKPSYQLAKEAKEKVKDPASGQPNKEKEKATIVNVVVDSAAHTTLKALITRAGLVEALQGAGKFTLFAPTNAAFASLGDSTLVKKITADPISDNFKPLLQDVSCCLLMMMM